MKPIFSSLLHSYTPPHLAVCVSVAVTVLPRPTLTLVMIGKHCQRQSLGVTSITCQIDAALADGLLGKEPLPASQ